jgi:hypothetical protein
MSDGWKAFAALGGAFAAHDSVCHSEREYVRGLVHANSAEGFNDRVRRTVSGVFHHIRPLPGEPFDAPEKGAKSSKLCGLASRQPFSYMPSSGPLLVDKFVEPATGEFASNQR